MDYKTEYRKHKISKILEIGTDETFETIHNWVKETFLDVDVCLYAKNSYCMNNKQLPLYYINKKGICVVYQGQPKHFIVNVVIVKFLSTNYSQNNSMCEAFIKEILKTHLGDDSVVTFTDFPKPPKETLKFIEKLHYK